MPHPWRTAISLHAIGLALALGLLGQVITFVPGAEAGWFAIAAILAALGLVGPGRRTRAVAAILVVGLAGLSWDG